MGSIRLPLNLPRSAARRMRPPPSQRRRRCERSRHHNCHPCGILSRVEQWMASDVERGSKGDEHEGYLSSRPYRDGHENAIDVRWSACGAGHLSEALTGNGSPMDSKRGQHGIISASSSSRRSRAAAEAPRPHHPRLGRFLTCSIPGSTEEPLPEARLVGRPGLGGALLSAFRYPNLRHGCRIGRR
jgi:hypothetical protein